MGTKTELINIQRRPPHAAPAAPKLGYYKYSLPAGSPGQGEILAVYGASDILDSIEIWIKGQCSDG